MQNARTKRRIPNIFLLIKYTNKCLKNREHKPVSSKQVLHYHKAKPTADANLPVKHLFAVYISLSIAITINSHVYPSIIRSFLIICHL